MQRVYELMVIFRPDFGLPAGKAGVDEKPIKDALSKFIGNRMIKECTVLGKKQLAYPIKKQSEGIYALVTFAGAPINVVELEKQLKSGTDILRYLLISK